MVSQPALAPETTQLYRDLNELVAASRTLRLVGPDQPSERQRQAYELARMRREVEHVRRGFLKALNVLPKTHKAGPERREISRQYVNAALLQLYLSLFYTRWNAPPSWYSGTGSVMPLREDSDRALKTFENALGIPPLELTAASYHTMATAFRAWADELSTEASTSSGWLDASSEVTRELRYRYQHYRTREVWAQVGESPPKKLKIVGDKVIARRRRVGLIKRSIMLSYACARSLFGIVSGYGMRARRFVLTTISIVLVFAGAYAGLDAQAACGNPVLTWSGITHYIFSSLGIFTSLGVVSGAFCSNEIAIVQALAGVESLFGYFMLGMLASIFLASFLDANPRVSRIRMRDS